jgi:hypothetical protein
MIFQVKKQRVQCYRRGIDEKRTMITSIKLGTSRNNIDLTDERNQQLTAVELEAYENWFNQREIKSAVKRNAMIADYEKKRPTYIDRELRNILSKKNELSEEQKELLIDCAFDVLKILNPEILEPKITLKMYLKSLFS